MASPLRTGGRILIVRHAEKLKNVCAVWHRRPLWTDLGWDFLDPPISRLGHQQAAEFANFACEWAAHCHTQPPVLVVSPFTRTMQTASRISARLGLPYAFEWGVSEFTQSHPHQCRVQPLSRLHELAMLTSSSPAAAATDATTVSVDAAFQSSIEKGSIAVPESVTQLCARVSAALAHILASFPDRDIIIVSHQSTMRALYSVCLGIPYDECARAMFCTSFEVAYSRQAPLRSSAAAAGGNASKPCSLSGAYSFQLTRDLADDYIGIKRTICECSRPSDVCECC
jgi:broad specificity phosphatase PhoE